MLGIAAFSFWGIEILQGWAWRGILGVLLGVAGIAAYVRLVAKDDPNTMRSPLGWGTIAAVAVLASLVALQGYGALPDLEVGFWVFVALLIIGATAAAVRTRTAKRLH
ncbi:MAG: hypothetical protein QOD77_1776 [Thermoplasmata archaeon]|nr:hypothetical protein [Thermoplasmata archaeon]